MSGSLVTTKGIVTKNNVTKDKRFAAMLEARGDSRKEIANTVGVAAETISRGRADDAYKAEVERWAERQSDTERRLVERLQLERAEAAIATIVLLREGLEALDADGNPFWWARLKAAERIRDWVPLTTGKGAAENDARALAAVTLVIRREGDVVEADE